MTVITMLMIRTIVVDNIDSDANKSNDDANENDGDSDGDKYWMMRNVCAYHGCLIF